MPYNASDEVENITGTFEKNKRGDKIRVRGITKKDNPEIALDVREMYTNSDGELRYNSKGIRVKSELASDVIIAMMEASGEDVIQDVLSHFDNR